MIKKVQLVNVLIQIQPSELPYFEINLQWNKCLVYILIH